jgi:Ca-activated chloride channel family protein
MTGLPVEPAMAFAMEDLWQRQDQQAHKALLDGDLEAAAKLARDPLRKGAAEYKQGNYEAAAKEFASAQGSEAAYNEGNALAKLGKYEEAIDAYKEALKEQNNMQDARYNKEAVETLLDQQKQQQQQQQKQNNKQGEKQDQQQGEEGEEGEEGEQDGQNSEQSGQGDSQQDKQQNKGSQSEQDKAEAGEESAENNAFKDAAEQAAAQLEKDKNESAQDEADNANTQQEKSAESQQQGENKEKDAMEQSTAEQQEADTNEKNNIDRSTSTAEELSSEEQIAAEQWLRRIPDDPAGLLRRKLRYQYIQRGGGQSGNSGDVQAW